MRTVKSDDVRMLRMNDVVSLFKEKMNYTANDARFILDNVVDMLVEDIFMNDMGVDLFGTFRIYPHDVPIRKVNSFDNSITYSKPRKRLYFECSKSLERRLTEKGKEDSE